MPPSSSFDVDPLDLNEIRQLIKVTELKAEACQRAAETMSQTLRILERIEGQLADILDCVRKTEGISTALAVYISARDGAESERAMAYLNSLKPASQMSVSVGGQSGGVKVEGDIKADRDAKVRGD